MKNSFAGVEKVPLEECKRRALAFGRTQTQEVPASEFALAIWPDHQMKPQGAGAAATRILKHLEAEGRAGWVSHYERGRWGWWAR